MTTQQKPLYGILLILCAGSLLATHDGVSKHLTHLYPLVMVIWARYAVQSVVMFLLFFPKMRWAIVRTRRPLLQLLLYYSSDSILSIALSYILRLQSCTMNNRLLRIRYSTHPDYLSRLPCSGSR